MLHSNIVVGDNHYIQNWSVADNTARDALVVTSADVGRVCFVTGTQKFFVLADDSPMSWTELGGGAGTGDVVGPASSTDNAVVRFDGTGGKTIQNSGITIADGATGTLAGSNSGDVTLDSSVTDIFNISSQALSADDPNADRIIFWDDSASKLTHLTAGTNLTITGTTLDAAGITLGTPVSSTSGTSIDFTSIPSTTKKITITLIGVSTNGSSDIVTQIGDSGGIETSGYTSNSAAINNASTTTFTATNYQDATGTGATETVNGVITWYLLDSSSNDWICESLCKRTTNNAVTMNVTSKATSATLDRVRITTANGTDTFDAGKINIQYQ